MVNLIAGKEVVPELVQADFTAENVVRQIGKILADGADRDLMLEGLAGVKARLRGPDRGSVHPSERAAEAILGLIGSTVSQ